MNDSEKHPTDPEMMKQAMAELEAMKAKARVYDGSMACENSGEENQESNADDMDVARGVDSKREAKEEQKRKRSENRRRREADLEERRGITEEDVRAKMRKSRRSHTPFPDEPFSYEPFSDEPFSDGPVPLPDMVHTYQSAELELKRQGCIKIRRNWLSIRSEEIKNFEGRESAEGITVSCAKIRDLGEHYILPEGKTSVDLRVWCSLKYFNGISDELFFVRPEEGEFEEWLPDTDFNSVVSRSFTAASSLHPIRSLCNTLHIAEPKDANDFLFKPPIVSCLDNLDDVGSLRGTHIRNLIGLLEDLGLFDYDHLYETNAMELYDDPERKDYADDPLGLFQDTFKESRELIVSDDPRSFWLELGEMDNVEIDFLRHQVAKLATVAYNAGYETCREEISNEHGRDLVRSHKMKEGRPQAGSTLTGHTRALKKAILDYEKKKARQATPAKLRDFILASGDDDLISEFEVAGFDSLKSLVKRHNDKKKRAE